MNSDSEDDEFNQGWEDEEEDTSCQSLFSDEIFGSVSALLDHEKTQFGFDLRACGAAVGKDDIALIMLVNYIRREVANAVAQGVVVNGEFAGSLQAKICQDSQCCIDDKNMAPVLGEDPLLYLLGEALDVDYDDEEVNGSGMKQGGENQNQAQSEHIAKLQQDLEQYKALVNNLMNTEDKGSNVGKEKEGGHNDEYYFDSYSHLSIHEVMLRDKPRTTTYGAALLDNASFLKDKVVLDVGCGTGILCMFAAKAGAKKVIGVDCSSIIERSKKVIEKNGYSDVITLVKGRLEEIELPIEKVDVIISEWMGYGLYFENMLSSVLFARDKYLSDTGVLMPSEATIYIDAMTAVGEWDRVSYWSDVYGFSMTEMDDLLTREAQVQYVSEDMIIGTKCKAHVLDIMTATDADLDFDMEFSMDITAEDSMLRGFVISFDVLFGKGGLTSNVPGTEFNEKVLSTQPDSETTHWKQCVLWLDKEHHVSVPKGTTVTGCVSYLRGESNKRDYDVVLTWINPITDTKHVKKYDLAS